MDNLMTTSDLVYEILKESEKARNSDNYLIYAVLVKIGRMRGLDVSKLSMVQVLLHMKEYGFPSFETIRRARQKIQHDNPELSGCDDVEAMRTLNEEEFRRYARS